MLMLSKHATVKYTHTHTHTHIHTHTHTRINVCACGNHTMLSQEARDLLSAMRLSKLFVILSILLVGDERPSDRRVEEPRSDPESDGCKIKCHD